MHKKAMFIVLFIGLSGLSNLGSEIIVFVHGIGG
jgi:hypothetical protein